MVRVALDLILLLRHELFGQYAKRYFFAFLQIVWGRAHLQTPDSTAAVLGNWPQNWGDCFHGYDHDDDDYEDVDDDDDDDGKADDYDIEVLGN